MSPRNSQGAAHSREGLRPSYSAWGLLEENGWPLGQAGCWTSWTQEDRKEPRFHYVLGVLFSNWAIFHVDFIHGGKSQLEKRKKNPNKNKEKVCVTHTHTHTTECQGCLAVGPGGGVVAVSTDSWGKGAALAHHAGSDWAKLHLSVVNGTQVKIQAQSDSTSRKRLTVCCRLPPRHPGSFAAGSMSGITGGGEEQKIYELHSTLPTGPGRNLGQHQGSRASPALAHSQRKSSGGRGEKGRGGRPDLDTIPFLTTATSSPLQAPRTLPSIAL